MSGRGAARRGNLGLVDAADALAQLMELSTEIVEVVTAGEDGAPEAFTGCSPDRADELARAGLELVALASTGSPASRIQVERAGGGLHVVVEEGRTAVATTVADATAGLVTHDLRAALRRSAPGQVDA